MKFGYAVSEMLVTAAITIMIATSLVSCYKSRPASIPSVVSPAQDWVLEVRCNSRNCGQRVDVLKKTGLEIHVEPQNELLRAVNSKRFLVMVTFVIPEGDFYKFDPSLTYLVLQSGKKVFATAGRNVVIRGNEGRIDADLITGPVTLAGAVYEKAIRAPLTLFFDVPPPLVSETFSLSMDGVIRGRESVFVPTLKFVRGER